MKRKISLRLTLSVFTFITLLVTSACTVSELKDEHPVVSETAIEKSFFVDTYVNEAGKKAHKSKTFLCGWASISETGVLSKSALIHQANMATHCNIEFEINERSLDGFLISPTYPDDRSKWRHVISIPIVKHYYYEKAKDPRYRETHQYQENTSRSHWSARTHMELDLKGMSIKEWAYDLSYMGAQITSIDDIEWDRENNFLGFTSHITGTALGNLEQATIRFNFLEFEHNPNFKKTYHHAKNSRYVNVLHVLGRKVEGVKSEYYVGKWDINKTHEFYLSGFPEKYVDVARDIVKDWNDTFYDIAEKRPFVIKTVNEVEHAFDLRRNTLIWVDDLEISMRSPLGMGIALSDVRNGEFKWASNLLYGGALEAYIKSFSSSESVLGKANHGVLMRRFNDFSATPSFNFEYPFAGDNFEQSFNYWMQMAQQDSTASNYRSLSPSFDIHNIETIKARFRQKLDQEYTAMDRFFQANGAASLVNLPGDQKILDMYKLQPDADFQTNVESLKEQLFKKVNTQNAMLMDMDRTFERVIPELVGALAEKKPASLDEVVRVAVKELMVHEFGHILGLGHQFKENILPAKGSVPDKYYETLKLKATEEQGYTNATSVMGYKDPRTELAQKYDDVVPGIQDKLTLRYIYNQEYPVYKQGDDDFDYEGFNTATEIPTHRPGQPEYKTSYFPQCNDLYASLSTDPYCNRFDRGHDAPTIMKSYVSKMTTNLISTLNAHSDLKNSNPQALENYLWYRSLSTYGRVRVFYDYMRLKYQSQLDELARDKDSLLLFSRSCQGGESNASLDSLFSQNPELKDLCVANGYAVNHMKGILALNTSDYTKLDYDNMYADASVTGGDINLDYGRIFGSWTQLTSLPVKIPALHALTTAMPFVNLGWLLPIPIYSTPNEKFHYSSFYPREYSSAISTTLDKNLRFRSSGDEETRIGSSVLALGYFMSQVQMSNDTNRFKTIMQELKKQTSFRFSMVAILVDKMATETGADPNLVYGFTGKVFDMRSGKETSLQTINVLPEGKVIVQASPGSIIYPISKLEFFDDPDGKWGNGFVLAYKMDFDPDERSKLQGEGAKSTLSDRYNSVLDSCFDNGGNGIRSFFSNNNKQDFTGFVVKPGIAHDSAKKQEFLDSVDKAFADYERVTDVSVEQCDFALDGIGQIVSAAALMNNLWLPHTSEYIIR